MSGIFGKGAPTPPNPQATAAATTATNVDTVVAQAFLNNVNQVTPGGKMVIPVGLPDTQHLIVAEKDLSGRVRTKQIMRVMFSLLEGSDQSPLRPS